MSNLLLQAIEKKFISKKVPVLRAGYQVRVHQKIKEGEKERIQIFEGMVIGQNAGQGASKTVTVRKVVEGIGVEKIFALNSPLIAKIEVKKTFKVRRAKLSYLRKPEGLSRRLSAKLGLEAKDEAHKKRKGLGEEEEALKEELLAPEPAEESTTDTEVDTMPEVETPEAPAAEAATETAPEAEMPAAEAAPAETPEKA